MKSLMLTTLTAAALVAAADTHPELDVRPTAITDYWNCTNHVNPTIVRESSQFTGTLATVTATSSEPASVPTEFESCPKSVGMSAIMTILTRMKHGLLLFFK